MSLTQETIALSQIEKQRRWLQSLSLTNFINTSEPQIAAGGRVEVADTLFYLSSAESITGWAGIGNDTECYIKIIPQGDEPPETALAEYIATVPLWSDGKHGFYGEGAYANHRYIGGLYKDAGGNYTKKWLYHSIDKSVQVIKIYGDGDIDIAGELNASAIPSDAINADRIDKSFTAGSQVIAAISVWVMPAGLYIFATGGTSLNLEINSSGWKTVATISTTGAMVLADGTNVRLNHLYGGGSSTVYYLKLD